MVYAERSRRRSRRLGMHRRRHAAVSLSARAHAAFGSKLEILTEATDRSVVSRRGVDHRPEPPLTARVIVNRLWHYIGTGWSIRRVISGTPPTHPELLDWLASELVVPSPPSLLGKGAGGLGFSWSLKRIHKLIVTSTAYRQSSRTNVAGNEKDAQSRLLWRYPPRRLEAEAIRDSILFVSGKLDSTLGGPGFSLFEPNSNYVRIYKPKTFSTDGFRRDHAQTRMQADGTFGAFDCPDSGQITRNATHPCRCSAEPAQRAFLLQQADFLSAREAKCDAVSQCGRCSAWHSSDCRRQPKRDREAGGIARPPLCRRHANANEFLYVTDRAS